MDSASASSCACACGTPTYTLLQRAGSLAAVVPLVTRLKAAGSSAAPEARRALRVAAATAALLAVDTTLPQHSTVAAARLALWAAFAWSTTEGRVAELERFVALKLRVAKRGMRRVTKGIEVMLEENDSESEGPAGADEGDVNSIPDVDYVPPEVDGRGGRGKTGLPVLVLAEEREDPPVVRAERGSIGLGLGSSSKIHADNEEEVVHLGRAETVTTKGHPVEADGEEMDKIRVAMIVESEKAKQALAEEARSREEAGRVVEELQNAKNGREEVEASKPVEEPKEGSRVSENSADAVVEVEGKVEKTEEPVAGTEHLDLSSETSDALEEAKEEEEAGNPRSSTSTEEVTRLDVEPLETLEATDMKFGESHEGDIDEIADVVRVEEVSVTADESSINQSAVSLSKSQVQPEEDAEQDSDAESEENEEIHIQAPAKDNVAANFLVGEAATLSVAAKARALDAWTNAQPKRLEAREIVKDAPVHVKGIPGRRKSAYDTSSQVSPTEPESVRRAVSARFVDDSGTRGEKVSVLEKIHAMEKYVETQPKFRPAKVPLGKNLPVTSLEKGSKNTPTQMGVFA